MAYEPEEKDNLLKELNLLNSLSKVASTPDGKLVIDFMLEKASIKDDPFLTSNSGEMCKLIGKQSVGRALVDKLIEAGVNVPANIFTKKKNNRIEEITLALNKFIGG